MYRNALRPDAWLTESHRFDMPGESAEIRLGVHATDTFDAAVAYAVHKASQEGDLIGGEPNCGIVFELDMSGLEPLPEADAVVVAKYEEIVISALQDVINEAKPGNVEDLAVVVGCFVQDMMEDGEPVETYEDWFAAFWTEHVFVPGPWVILYQLELLAENDSETLMIVLQDTFKHGHFPLELWAQAIGQYRYMDLVGFDRLLRVWAIRPVSALLVDDEFVDDDENEPQWFSMYDVGHPVNELLWDSGRRVDNPKFHGTDISRARNEFPEIEDVIVSQWPYGQPDGIGPL